jgi:hypothetical protein
MGWYCTLVDPCLLSVGNRVLLVHVVRVAVSGLHYRMYSKAQCIFFMGRQSRHVGVTTMEELDQGSTHPLLEHPRHNCPCRGLNPRPLALPDSLFTTIRNIYVVVHEASTAPMIMYKNRQQAFVVFCLACRTLCVFLLKIKAVKNL